MAERISFLDSAKAVGIVMVVGVHSFGRAGISAESIHNLAQTNIISILWFIVYVISVPVFFLVDGYLFANKIEKTPALDYKPYVFNSAKRLLLPWLIFNVGYTTIRAVFEYAGYFSQNQIIGSAPGDFFLKMYMSSAAIHLYFLPALFIVRTLSVITKYLVVKPPYVAISIFISYAFLFGCCIENSYKTYLDLGNLSGLDPLIHGLWGLQYYLLGIVFYKLRFYYTKTWLPISVLAILSAFYARILFPDVPVVAQYLYLISFFLFFSGVRGPSFLAAIGPYTMGIYVLHSPILIKGTSILANRTNSHNELFNFFIIWITTFAIAYLLTRIIYRIPYGKFVFGEKLAK